MASTGCGQSFVSPQRSGRRMPSRWALTWRLLALFHTHMHNATHTYAINARAHKLLRTHETSALTNWFIQYDCIDESKRNDQQPKVKSVISRKFTFQFSIKSINWIWPICVERVCSCLALSKFAFDRERDPDTMQRRSKRPRKSLRLALSSKNIVCSHQNLGSDVCSRATMWAGCVIRAVPFFTRMPRKEIEWETVKHETDFKHPTTTTAPSTPTIDRLIAR